MAGPDCSPFAEPRKFLAATLTGRQASWFANWEPEAAQSFLHAVRYHGVSGLLVERDSIANWPPDIALQIREEARQRAMWELRHRSLLSELLAVLAAKGVRTVLMKGAALAYDVYGDPAARPRSDTDVLIAASDLPQARQALERLGFAPHPMTAGQDDDLAQQESWVRDCGDGTSHDVDVHWQVLNAPALAGVFDVQACIDDATALPRLCPEARSMDRARLLFHVCLHQAVHRKAPFFVDGQIHFGGDRLIWSNDVHALADRLSADDWAAFTDMGCANDLAGECMDALRSAQRDFQTVLPAEVMDMLTDEASRSGPSYLQRSGAVRVWEDLKSIEGNRQKFRYVRQRLLPSGRFMRAKYPDMARAPVALLYVRRIVDALRK